LFKPSVKTLLKRGDAAGLVSRLDQKDMGEAWMALTVMGAPAVPALIDALGTERSDAACGVLAEIGAPALPGLVDLIAGDGSGREDADERIEAAGTAVATMRSNGVPLPEEEAGRLGSVQTDPQASAARKAAAVLAQGLLGAG
jgi:hypothetical protein